MNYLLLMINIFMLVCGQVLWKMGMSKFHLKISAKGIINTLLNPYIFLGGIFYLFAAVIWLYLLSKEEISRIYPLQSLCYIIGAIAGVVIFNESIGMSKLLGLLLIFIGAGLVGIK